MIIIPMCGQSSRFFKAGYTLPKYMLKLNELTIFEWSLLSFKDYFNKQEIVIICNSNIEFIKEKLQNLKISKYKIINLNHKTNGQATTVYEGLNQIKNENNIWIFNIDSKLLNFKIPSWINNCDGYLEVFNDDTSDNWSFISVNNEKVINVTEKERISNLCSNGLYYFKSTELFKKYYLKSKKVNNEYYIAPIYNEMIKDNLNIRYNLIDKSNVNFCGIPSEYKKLLKENKNGN